MSIENRIGWHTPATPPPNNGSYLCDVGDPDPVVMIYRDGHWLLGLIKMSAKDEWVKYWSHLPKQIR